MIKMYVDLHIKYLLFLSDSDETWIFWQIFEKSPNIKFHKNPSSGSRVVSFEGRTDGGREKQANRYEEANSHFSQFCKWS
jgi:hypothetical protein